MFEKISKKWEQVRLNRKIVFAIAIVLIIPMTVFFISTIKMGYKNGQDESRIRIELETEKVSQQINYISNISESVTNIISNNKVLNYYLRNFNEGVPYSKEQYNIFEKEQVSYITNLIKEFTDDISIRIYFRSDSKIEFEPVFYSTKDLSNIKWNNIKTEGWILNYDNMDKKKNSNNSLTSAGYIKILSDDKNNRYGIIEVTIDMQKLFPDIDKKINDTWTVFYGDDDKYYYNHVFQEDGLGKMLRWLDNNVDYSDINGKSTIIDYEGKQLLVASRRITYPGGYIIKIRDLTPLMHKIWINNYGRYILMLVICLLVLMVINIVVKKMLNQFYVISDTVNAVSEGNLKERIVYLKNDEFGTLGREINSMLDKIQILMKEAVDKEILRKNSQIKSLHNQINTHFIYNILETIKMMAEIDEKYDISDAITSLATLLRYGMHWSSHKVTVEEELDYIKNYIILINLRFDYEVHFDIEIPKDILKQQIPKMSLQPIIENAIYHGIGEEAEDINIHINGKVENGYCNIKITDSGCGMTQTELDNLRKKIEGNMEIVSTKGNGIGLKNVHDRLRITFGKEYGLTIDSKEGVYTQVCLKIPYEYKEDRSKTVYKY